MRVTYLKLIVALIVISGLPVEKTVARQSDIIIELRMEDALTSSQIINLTTFQDGGDGSQLFTLFIQNKGDQRKDSLYLNFKIRSGRGTILAEAYQPETQPFSLDPGQVIYATNNSIEAGSSGTIALTWKLTDEGKELVNQLGGSTILPGGTYTVEAAVSEVQNSLGGDGSSTAMVSSVADLGEELQEDIKSIYLLGPGDVNGSNAVINNSLPVFRWEGQTGVQYRLLVVEAQGADSPESLLQGSQSTGPVIENGSFAAGSLLDYEVLDVILEGSSFQLPASGVRQLKPGATYYWQVIAQLQSATGLQERFSEIWSFVLDYQGSSLNNTMIPVNEELLTSLQELVGEENYQLLQSRGLRLESVIIDGQTLTGVAALQKLLEIREKLNRGEASIVVE